MDRGNKAKENFMHGYNCAQAVALAFADVTGLDEDVLLRTISPFGGGMGRLREVCGAVSGMFYVLGCVKGYSTPNDLQSKRNLYADVQLLAGRFKAANGSIVCHELIGVPGAQSPVPEPRTDEYYKKRPCAELVKCAANILEEFLTAQNLLQ